MTRAVCGWLDAMNLTNKYIPQPDAASITVMLSFTPRYVLEAGCMLRAITVHGLPHHRVPCSILLRWESVPYWRCVVRHCVASTPLQSENPFWWCGFLWLGWDLEWTLHLRIVGKVWGKGSVREGERQGGDEEWGRGNEDGIREGNETDHNVPISHLNPPYLTPPNPHSAPPFIFSHSTNYSMFSQSHLSPSSMFNIRGNTSVLFSRTLKRHVSTNLFRPWLQQHIWQQWCQSTIRFSTHSDYRFCSGFL